MSGRFRLYAVAAVAFLLAGAALIEAYEFAELSTAYLAVPPSSDSTLFLAMGRAWLNGLHFYRDLFETKPPGVFLLAALSLRSSMGSEMLIWMQLILLAALPLALARFAMATTALANRECRWLAVALSFVLGLAIADETLYRTGGYLAEGFGLLFATLPVLLFVWPASTRRRRWLEWPSGISLGVAVVFMEPFGLSGLLGMAMGWRSRTDAWRLLRVAAIAGATAVCLLALSGSLADYVTLYLPEMLGGRSTGAIIFPDFGRRLYFVINAPLWVQSLNIEKLLTAFPSPATSAFLPAFFAVCGCLWPVLRTRSRGWLAVATSAVLLTTAVIATHAGFVLYELLAALDEMGKAVPWLNPRIVELTLLAVGLPAVVAVAIAALSRNQRAIRAVAAHALALSVGLVLATTLIAMGGGNYRAPYLIFAFPPLVALALDSVNSLAVQGRLGLIGLLAGLLIVNAGVPGQLASNLREVTTVDPINQWLPRVAPAFDSLLTHCHESRYLMGDFELRALGAATKHSPYQLDYGVIRAFGAFEADSPNAPNPYLAAKFRHDLRTARIIVTFADDDPSLPARPVAAPIGLGVNGITVLPMDGVPNRTPTSRILAPIATALRRDFTTDAPPCARDDLPISGLTIYFRRS